MNSFTLCMATRKIGKKQTPREYFEFFVSGQSLWSILHIEDDDLITLFGWGDNTDYNKHILNVFKLKEKSKLDSGRVMIDVCPECGGIDCGAITTVIKDYGYKIIWSEFGYETGYGGLIERFDQIDPIEFDRASYFSAFSSAPV